jgi:serine/threonine protein phosphatase PrpC
MPPKKRKGGERNNDWRCIDIEVGLHALQGERPTMEDAHSHSTLTIPAAKLVSDVQCSKKRPLHFLGVFDGHGGDQAAEFAAEELPKQVKQSLTAGLALVPSLVTAHMATEVSWFRSSSFDDSGTTAISVMLETATGRITVCNVGDSRAFVVPKTGPCVALSTDHDAENKKEAKRMKAASNAIWNGTDEDGYINDQVQTSRSIGDFDAKFLGPAEDTDDDDGGGVIGRGHRYSDAVVCTPEIAHYQLQADDLCLVLGCDGLVEASEGKTSWVGKEVRSQLKKGRLADEIARHLAETALEMGSGDNISCMVVIPSESS